MACYRRFDDLYEPRHSLREPTKKIAWKKKVNEYAMMQTNKHIGPST